MDNPNLTAALRLADLGIAVFPCATDKRPRPGVRWKEEATTDQARIASWWRRWPDSLPAYQVGRHGMLAIDLDGNFGFEDWDKVRGDHEEPPVRLQTPGGGHHIFFKQDGSFGNSRGTLPPKRKNPVTREDEGIDIRGAAGYVIAEGAIMPDGRTYEPVANYVGLLDAMESDSVPPLPDWLAAVLTAKPVAPAAPAVSPALSTPRQSAGGQSEFFRKTNEAALRRLDEWVPGLFPRARYQPGTGAYRVSSRELGRDLQEDLSLSPTGIVDFGVADMGDANQGKRTPIDVIMEHAGAPDAVAAARWLCEKLGLDAAAEWDASRAVPDIDLSRLKPRSSVPAEPVADDPEPEPEVDEDETAPIDEALTHVGGVLGDVVDYITETSRRPNRRLSLAAALTICGTMLGRRMATPTNAGLQLYVISTYPTGGGKQHPLDCIDRLFRVTDLQRHIGPSQFMSMSALVKHALSSPLSICPQDEFGAMLKRLSHPRASGHEMGISMVLRSLWGANFTTIRTPAYATSASTDIAVPALSLYGSTTAKELYDALRGQDVVNGFLNRFIVIDAGARVGEEEPRYDLRSVPDRLREGLLRLYQMGASGKGNLGFSCKNQANDPQPVKAQWGSQDAEDCYRDLSARMQAMMDADPEMEPFLPRVAENAVRCATIRACGEDNYTPLVTLEHMQWAAELSEQSARRLIADAGKYMTDPLGAAEFERKLLAKVKTGGRRGIRMRELHRTMSKHQRFATDLRNAVDALVRSGVVVVEEMRLPGGVSRRVRMA